MTKDYIYKRKTIEIDSNHILFFDLDGTLVHTDFSNFLAYKKAIEAIKPEFKNIEFDSNKRITRRILKEIMPLLSNLEEAKIINMKENYYDEFLPYTELNEVVFDVLIKCLESNRCILVTNCRENRASSILNYYNLTLKFDSIFCKEDMADNFSIVMNKFKNVIEKMNVLPKNVIVFENTLQEIKNALKAGIKIINPIIKNL